MSMKPPYVSQLLLCALLSAFPTLVYPLALHMAVVAAVTAAVVVAVVVVDVTDADALSGMRYEFYVVRFMWCLCCC